MALESESGRLRFLDLGVLAIERDGVAETVRGRRLATLLAALLIDADRHVSVDRLVDALWGGSPKASTSTLDSHLFRLRQLLEPSRRRGTAPTVLLSEPRGYRLVVTPDQVDSLRFEQLVSDARRLLADGEPERALRRCEDALSSWRGQPFTPVGDEDFAAPAATRLTELHDELTELELGCLLGTGDAAAAPAKSASMVSESTLREGVWAARMLAAYRTGQPELALDAYRAARTRSARSWGSIPVPSCNGCSSGSSTTTRS